jgi:hypothetical protein
MTALPERAAPCSAAERPTDILSLCAALALCGEAIEPHLDVGDANAIKPQGTYSGLDVVLHVALIRRGCERGKIRSNDLLEPLMEELPNCGHLGGYRAARGFPRELYPPAVDYLPSSSVHIPALTLT